MVVDDDPALLAAVGRALRLDGHEVRQAADGALALEALTYFAADLIVLDVMMPSSTASDSSPISEAVVTVCPSCC